MKSVYTIIQELASTRSLNDKKSILQSEVNNEELKTFFRLALSNQIRFYQKQPFGKTSNGIVPLKDCFEFLEHSIAKRSITGNTAYSRIADMMNTVSMENYEVLSLVLQKKTGCDIGVAVVNKIWPKLVPDYPCMLATNWDEKLAAKLFAAGDDVYSQLKSDGLRVNIVIDEEGIVSAYTRAGNELELFGKFDVLGTIVQGVVIDGELLTINQDGKFNSRQVSNGICSKAIHGTMSRIESEMLHMTAWDMIPLADFKDEKSNLYYYTRMYSLQNLLSNNPNVSKLVSMIETRKVKNIQEANDHYQELQARGEEGTIVKSSKMMWGSTRSKLQLKLKSELPCDLIVKGWVPGKGELEGNLGALTMCSSDGKVEVNMSGFSLKLRSEIFANLTNAPVDYGMVVNSVLKIFTANPGDCPINIDSIVEVTYNAKIKSKTSDVWSLFLPRFSKVRLDKSVPNSFEEIK